MKNLTIKHITRWKCPSNYMGETYESYYVVYSRHRDSDLITESNWDAILSALGGESETVIVTRASHWAIGWMELLLVHETDSKALEMSDELIRRIEDYPILNEEDYFTREAEAKNAMWELMNLKERICLCLKSRVSIFAARHDFLTKDLDMYLEV